jgi:hypothetical protein
MTSSPSSHPTTTDDAWLYKNAGPSRPINELQQLPSDFLARAGRATADDRNRGRTQALTTSPIRVVVAGRHIHNAPRLRFSTR